MPYATESGGGVDGSRDQELGLHLMFLSWYLLCEPPHLTGLNKHSVPLSSLAPVFHEVHEHFIPTIKADAEMLYVVGLMTVLFPYFLGDTETMEALAREYRTLYRLLEPRGLAAEVFTNRGAYGDYFESQARVVGGY
jgi:hypothetical protein